MFIITLILKVINSTQKSKKVSSQSNLQAFKRYICIYKEQKEHPVEENQQCVSSFFLNKREEICGITNKRKRKNDYDLVGK